MKLRTPSYRLHRPSGQAVVTLNGRDVYLGVYGTQASRNEYDRVIGEWLTSGRTLRRSADGSSDITVAEIASGYVKFASTYYIKDGSPTSELHNVESAMRQLGRLYGRTLARDFGPLALKALREEMISEGRCRRQINIRVSRIVAAFKWASANELLPVTVYQALKTVPGLRAGRTEAVESEPVKPVPDAYVDAIQPHVSRQIWAMVQLQRLTGMRPGEVASMRTCDLNTQGNVWEYRPASHKTQHHGHAKVIFLGPRAQEVLRPWLKTDLQAFLFSPAEAVAEWQAIKRQNRKSKVQPSQVSRAVRTPRHKPGDQYNSNAYRRAIQRACERAGVPAWHPHQLRHNAATWLRKEFGLDVARVVLGHRSAAITEVYAELDKDKARDIMAKIG